MTHPTELKTILANHPPFVCALVKDLRRLLRDLALNAKETVYPRWQGMSL